MAQKGKPPPKGKAGAYRRTPVQVQSSRGWVPYAVVSGVIVVGLLLIVIVAGQSGSKKIKVPSDLQTVLAQGQCTVDERADSGQSHVANATYTVNPPAGGSHDPNPAAPGVYTAANVPADPHLVHSQEHGFVILWYRNGIPDDQVKLITAAFDRFPGRTIVAPRLNMPEGIDVAATAWHNRMLCKTVATDPLTSFIQNFSDKGPESGFIN